MNDIQVSEHAILRYIQRIHRVDLEQVKAQILKYGVKDAIDAGSRKCRVDGIEFVIKERTIVTVYCKSDHNAEKRRLLDLSDTRE